MKAPLSDVAWYSNYDEEKTVILLPQNKGGQWTVASEEVVPSSEYGSDSEKAVAVQPMLLLLRESKETDR